MSADAREAAKIPPQRKSIGNCIQSIEFNDGQDFSQDHEFCDVVVDGVRRRIRFHDYHELYRVPGLYEKVFYEKLKCCSPRRVVSLLADVMKGFGDDPDSLRVLDVGAGNGMVGERLQKRGVDQITGVDIISEAKMATVRDRPGVYSDYFVTDLTDLPEPEEHHLRSQKLNCLTSVAALGFGDLPSLAFAKAMDLIETPGWLAFTIKEDFLYDCDTSGFCQLISQLRAQRIIQIQAYRRYAHRRSTTGKRLYYVAMIARKLRDVPDELLSPTDMDV